LKPAGSPAIAMVLPVREGFGPQGAGAIAMVVRRHAVGAAGVVVLGGAQNYPVYPDVGFCEAAGASPWLYGVNVLRILRRLRPEVVEVHQQPGLARLLARLLPGSRVLLFLHNDPLEMRGLRSARARRRALAALHRVVCVSAYLRDRYMLDLAASHPEPEILHNPLNLQDFERNSAIRRNELLYAGRIVETKGVADFIAACAQLLPELPGWRARIIGGDRFGPASPETQFYCAMRQAAQAAGIRFDGPQPHDFVLKAMAEAAIVVVPSRWPEPFGLTALEAMASGAALIAAETGGLPEVAGEAARYVPPGDVAALAAALRALAADSGARARLAEAGLARARAFDLPVTALRLQALRGPISAL
jgi:UDP-glucose:(glucosyl)LPS alpha-1,2-glucosyltransferase